MGREAKWVVRLDATERQELETLLATCASRVSAHRWIAAEVERGGLYRHYERWAA